MKRMWGCHYGNLRIVSQLFADVVLFDSFDCDLQGPLAQCTAGCEVSGWESAPPGLRSWYPAGKQWIWLFKLDWATPLRQGVQVSQCVINQWGSEGAEPEMDRLVWYQPSLYWTVVVQRELSRTLKLDQSFYVPTLIHGHELWVWSSSDVRRKLGVEPLLLHVERSQWNQLVCDKHIWIIIPLT